jgi:hypothetical protein
MEQECTASGNAEGSRSYSGAARAFHSNGAHSLLLSHWPACDDAATLQSVVTLWLAGRFRHSSDIWARYPMSITDNRG